MSTNTEYPNFEYTQIRPPLGIMEGTLKWKPNNFELPPNCPRCSSSNTKFCYYNNYSLSQPRYFCKACRRYWTKGGSLRNVPIGGGCRKARRTRTPARQDGATNYPASTLGSECVVGPTIESESGGDIDPAVAVFTKNDESSSFAASYDKVHSQMEDSSNMFEYGQALDLINGADDDQSQQVNNGYIDGQDFAYQNYDAFDIAGVFGGEVAAENFWSEGIDFPQHELQDFGVFSTEDDQLRMSANLVSENWGSFDLPGYEIFTRP